MRKKCNHGGEAQGPIDSCICFEPLEPRLLLSGSWGTGAEAPSADAPATPQDAFTREAASIADTAGAFDAESLARDRGTPIVGNLVDLLSEAPAINVLGVGDTEVKKALPPDESLLATDYFPTTTSSRANTDALDSEPQTDATVTAARRELVMVNADIADYEELIADMNYEDGERIIDVVILNADREGITQVNAILAERSDLAAVHVLTHGANAQIHLGNTWLDRATLEQNRAAVAAWGDALSESGDILFYGCNLAADSEGQMLLADIAELTRTEVAASDDATGHAVKGGDWVLEYATGAVDTRIALPLGAIGGWSHLLAPPVANDDPGDFNADLLMRNPHGYWRLGETSGPATDLGSSTNAGVYHGGTLGQAGAIAGDGDTAVRFDGAGGDYVDIAHSGDYLLDNGTVQLWFNTDAATTGNLQHLFSKDSNGFDTGGHLSIYLNASGNLTARLQSTTASYFVSSPSAVTANQWHHAAFSFGADGMKLYLDGQSVDTNGYTGGLGTTSGGAGNSEPIAIGGGTQRSDNNATTPVTQLFTGLIDEVALFGGQLDAETIKALYGVGSRLYTTGEDQTLDVSAAEGVLINDFDNEKDPLTVVEVNGSTFSLGAPIILASGAQVTLNADGSFVYDPNGRFDHLDQGQTATDSFSYVANDGSADSNPATVTITVAGTNDTPLDLRATATTAGGISLNADGGNDTYLLAGSGLATPLSQFTVECQFEGGIGSTEVPFISYSTGSGDIMTINTMSNNSLELDIGTGSVVFSSAVNYNAALMDGQRHTLSVSWDNTAGDWAVYIDGALIDNGTGLSTGETIPTGGTLMFGLEQDSVGGGFESHEFFNGTLYDVRLFDDVRTATEISANHQSTLAPTEPGLIANWTFDDLSTGGVVVDAVGGNNLTVQHVGAGGGFTPSTPALTLEIPENAPDGSVVGTVAGIDPDAGDTLSYSLLDDAGGRFAILPATGVIRVADGSLLNYASNTRHDVTVRVTDALSHTYDEVFTIHVTNIDEPPLAVTDSFTVAEGTTTTLDLAANDSDPENGLDLTSIAIVSGPTHGSVAVNADGTVDYMHDGTENYADAFTYNIADNAGVASNTVTVDLTVTPQNDAPFARPDGVHLSFDGDDFIRVANDASLQMINHVSMEAWINHNGGGTGSQLILNKEGEYEMGITADTGEVKYAVAQSSDSWAWHNTGTFVTPGEWTHVAVAFDGVAGAIRTYINGQLVDTLAQPGPMGDVYATYNDLTIGGRENATNQRFQGQIDEVRVWKTTRTQAEIQANMNSLLTGGEAGLAGYWRLDEAGTGNVVDLSANSNGGLLGGAEGASATPAYQGYVTDEDTLLSIPAISGVLANDSDEENASLSVGEFNGSGLNVGTPVVLASGARATLNTDGSIIYDPAGQFEYLASGETATDTFSYVSNDGSRDSNPATVTITVTGFNDAPVAFADSFTVAEGSTTGLNLAANDSDAEGGLDLTSIAIVSGPTYGAIVVNGDGTVDYSHNGTENFTDSFTYTIDDNAGVTSNTMTVSLTITPQNDAPVAVADHFTVNEGSPMTLNLAGNDSDSDDGLDLASVAIVSGPTYGAIVVNGDGTVNYTHDGSETVSDSFAYAIDDFFSATSNTVTVNLEITPQNDAPVNTAPATIRVDEETPTVLAGLTIGDIDVADGDLTTRLRVSNGVMDVTMAGSAIISAGTNGANDLTVQGTIADINATLASLTYTGNPDVFGLAADTLSVQTGDGGNNGAGGAMQDTDNIQIDVMTVTTNGADTGDSTDPPPTVGRGTDTRTEMGDEPVVLDTAPAPKFEYESAPAPEPQLEEILPSGGEAPTGVETGASTPKLSPAPKAALVGSTPHGGVPMFSTTHIAESESPATEQSVFSYVRQELSSRLQARFTPAASAFFSSDVMTQELDHIQKQIDEFVEQESEQGKMIIGTAASLGASVFVGYVIWAFRGASLLFGALSAMPMWRCFDPLPVLLGDDKKRERDEEENQGEFEREDDERHIRDLLDAGPEKEGQA